MSKTTKESKSRFRLKKKESVSKANSGDTKTPNKVNKKGKENKGKRSTAKKVILAILVVILVAIGSCCVFAGVVIAKAPKINPDKIYDILTESTIVYDDQEKEIDTVYTDVNRDNVSYKELPDNLKHAFIALEDKSFERHHGFNFIRIMGAIKDSIFKGGRISGTSTITQQLARNVYLKETQYDYDIKRKIIEAYYTVILEKNLTKDQILEAYLNTIFFGFNSSGVGAASQSYFSEEVKDLTLPQCAALAALPQSPSAYQLVELIPNGNPKEYKDVLIKEAPEGLYVINDVSKSRRELCLKLMLKQGYISQKEYDAAVKVSLKDMLKPSYNSGQMKVSYFADYVINEVIEDLMKEKGIDKSQATDIVYKGGLKIYSTMDRDAQETVEAGLNNGGLIPVAAPSKDSQGNIVNRNGAITLYSYSNMFDDDGSFRLYHDEVSKNKDGDLIIKSGGRLAIYNTKVDGKTDYSLEFKPMYKYEDGDLYAIGGGYVNIPAKYKSRNDDDDLVIDKSFFKEKEYKNYFVFKDNGDVDITPAAYTLREKVIQPQTAMTVIENKTGHIKAMVGGRGTVGRKIFNRATNARQPGSSIKPIAVYGPALQQSYEEAKAGKKHEFKDLGIDKQGKKFYGDYFTEASIIVDEPTKIDGRVWPRNFSGTNVGPITFKEALANSLNTTSVKTLLQMGIGYSEKMLEKFGISTLVTDGNPNDNNPSALALGGMVKGTSTLEMASAFTAFANEGKRVEPSAYTKVVDKDGKVLLDKENKTVEVMDPGVAYVMIDILKATAQRTGAAFAGTPIAGKTGTTDDQYDIWFNGITPNYTASIWIGNDNNFELSDFGYAAARAWSHIMSRIDNARGGAFPGMPSNVIQADGYYFLKGTEGGRVPIDKVKVGDDEVVLKICKETGLLATPDCKDVEERTFKKDDPKIPKFYCNVHNSDPKKYPTGKEEEHKPDDKPKPPEEGGTNPPENGNGNGNGGGQTTQPSQPQQ